MSERRRFVSDRAAETHTVSVAALQMSVAMGRDNVSRALRLVDAASAQGAEVVVLQEFFATGAFTWTRDPAHFRLAESLEGPTVQKFRQRAAQHRVALVVPIFEADAHCQGRYYNSAIVITSNGEVLGTYRKQQIPLNERTHERFYFAPGNLGSPAFPLGDPDISLGICLCFDRHFPEIPHTLAARGADVILVPTSTNRARVGREEIWRAELIAMAVQTGRYVLGVNSCGSGDGKEQFGHSALVAPDGTVVNELDDEEGILLGEVVVQRPQRRADRNSQRARRHLLTILRDVERGVGLPVPSRTVAKRSAST